MHIRVDRLTKRFAGFTACDDVSFEIENGRLIGLLGPSGGGKTTLLRMLAGLERPDTGDIWFDGRRVNDVPPQKRGIGFVFQHYALFKHMTVFDNIAFGLKIRKAKKAEIRERVAELVELTGLGGLERRYPHQLSGGQRQRVAFARALAPKPELLLLDEPFAAIDAKVRKELRAWLKETIHRLGVTTVFVTHDQEEAAEVADEIMIIHQGKLQQKGTPLDIYRYPRTPFVASFIGEASRLYDPDRLKGFEEQARGMQAIVRPEFVEIGREREILTPSAAEPGIVRNVAFRGGRWLVEAEIGGRRIVAYRPLEKEPLAPGESVLVLIHRLFLFDERRSLVADNAAKEDPIPVRI